MKAINLTSDQQAQAIALKTAATTARTSARTARKALEDYLLSISGITPAQGRIQQFKLTDDGKTLIVLP